MKLTVYTDGAARGNPGPAAIGAVIKDEKNQPVSRISQRIGFATNNQAEYIAVITALEKAVKMGASQVTIKSDSELVVKQLNGKYRVKKASLMPLFQRVGQLIGSFESFTITYIPREHNRQADQLANRALDAK